MAVSCKYVCSPACCLGRLLFLWATRRSRAGSERFMLSAQVLSRNVFQTVGGLNYR